MPHGICHMDREKYWIKFLPHKEIKELVQTKQIKIQVCPGIKKPVFSQLKTIIFSRIHQICDGAII